jgi:uncharacterized protein (DUF1697 family)
MKYLVLLRGLNVGGKNVLRMADLKRCLEQNGFSHVSTYIQSGNVIFDSEAKDVAQLTRKVQKALSKTCGYDSAIVLKSRDQLQAVVARAPREWKTGAGVRRYVAFLRSPLTATRALGELEPRPGVDSVKAGEGVLYMSTLMSRLKQSGFTKVIGKEIYQQLTIRNYSTCQKILDLMQSK